MRRPRRTVWRRMMQQGLHNKRVALSMRSREYGVPMVVFVARVHPSIEQQSQNCSVPRVRGNHERRHVVVCGLAGVDLCHSKLQKVLSSMT